MLSPIRFRPSLRPSLRPSSPPSLRPSPAGRERALAAASLLAAALICFTGLHSPARAQAAAGKKAKGTTPSVARGKYLVMTLGCNDCHTPFKMGANGPEPDMSKALSGHPQDLAMPAAKLPDMPWAWMGSASMTAFAGPWGTTFAPNLTPDEETGTGAWDEDFFVSIFRSKKWMGSGRPIMPPMPIDDYTNLTDGDLKAIFAYLRTLPPIKNKVPDFIPAAGGPGGGGGQ